LDNDALNNAPLVTIPGRAAVQDLIKITSDDAALDAVKKSEV
jgi:hypothetical protein